MQVLDLQLGQTQTADKGFGGVAAPSSYSNRVAKAFFVHGDTRYFTCVWPGACSCTALCMGDLNLKQHLGVTEQGNFTQARNEELRYARQR